jgi:hypothetical protein
MMECARQGKQSDSDEAFEYIEGSAPYANISPTEFHIMYGYIDLVLLIICLSMPILLC